MSAATLTERTHEVYLFIGEYAAKYGVAATFRDIGAHFGWSSPNAVARHVRQLESAGLIRQPTGSKRGYIPVVQDGHCPMCGQALEAKGTPAPVEWDPIEKGA